MFITTSRDPSSKARRFARALASFLSLAYVNRGKHRLDGDEGDNGDEPWLVMIEDHGNPAGLVKHCPEDSSMGETRLSFQLTGDPEGRRLKRMTPMVVGEGETARVIAQFFELEQSSDCRPVSGRVIQVASGSIDFMDEGEIKFRLRI
jgi:rRNA maturation protein Rpf1